MMRWTICPLLSILFLLAVGMALSCRAVVRWSVTSHRPLENSTVDDSPVIINSTLLRFAAIEIGEEETQQEINGLLEGNFGKKGHYRSISSWRRYNHFVERPRSSRRVPIQLRSPKYYRVWPDFLRFLRNWSSNKRFQPEIMMELINITKQPLDQHYGFKGLDRPYVSCAIVGNSGVLLKNEYGELIDGHEIVIRLNNAQVEGFQKHVGSKTNISFVNSNILHLCSQKEGCFCHPYGKKVAMVMYICQALHFLDYTICTPSHKAPLLVTDARFDVLCTRIAKYYSLKRFVEEKGKPPEEWAAAHEGSLFHYSSGMQAVVLALGICERVSIFGFGKSVLSKHHYHTNQKTELHLHDYEAEYVFYHDLVKRPQVIPFLKDSGFKIPPVTIYH